MFQQEADYMSAVHTACLHGDIDRTEELLISNQNSANQRNESGQTPLQVVVVTAEGTILEDLLNLLLFFKADPNARGPSGDTPLHDVINVGRLDSAAISVPLLLRAGAEPKLTNRNGQTAIDSAILQNYLELAQLMQDYKENPKALDEWEEKREQQPPPPKPQEKKSEEPKNDDRTANNHAMLNAVIRGDQKKVKELLDDGADINFKNQEGFAALHYAVSRCASSREEMTKLLAVTNMADVNAATKESDTPLSLCIKKNHTEEEILKIAQILLDQGANKDEKDLDGKDALQLAQDFRLPRVYALLSGGQQPPREKTDDAEDPNEFEGDYHPVHLICKDEKMDATARAQALDAEFNKGVYINIRTKPEHDTCLMIACRREDRELVQYLLDRDATVAVTNNAEDTPLTITRQLKNRPIEQLLLAAQRKQLARSRWKKAGVAAAATNKGRSCVLL